MVKLKNKIMKTKGLYLLIVFLIVCMIIVILTIKTYQERQTLKNINELFKDDLLIYGADDSAPPLRFVDKDGIYKGVVVDYVNQIALELGIEIKCEPYRWEDALKALEDGKTDICDMFMNKQRAEKYVFTDPIYTLRTVAVVLYGKDYTLQDINSMKVATQKGDYANGYMVEKYPNADLIYVHDIGEGLDLLLEGKVDAVVGDEPVVSYFALEKKYNDKIQTINTALYEEKVVLGVNKDKHYLVDGLNLAIQKLKSEGQLEKIQQKWFGISKPLIETTNTEAILNWFMIIIFIAAIFLCVKQLETISLRKQVKKRTKDLEASRNELKLIFNEMPEGVIVVNRNKEIVSCNEAASKIADIPLNTIVGGKCSSSFKSICENCNDCIVESCFKQKKDLTKKSEMRKGQYEFRAFYIEKDESSENIIMVTIKDITLEEIQNKHLLQSSKMIAIGQLAAGMAHQIRNPLGVVRTHSFIIRRNHLNDYKLIQSLDYIDSSVKRASGIIDNVMNFWRISEVKFTEINIFDYLYMIHDLELNEITNQKVNVIIDCPSDLIFKTSDEALKNILLNLLQNSMDAAPREGGEILLYAKKTKENDLLLQCRDNGSGIEKKNIDNLFNPFFTTKAPGSGTGLGLYIVYSEIENLRGTISVESEVGKGTIFTIVLPHIEGK